MIVTAALRSRVAQERQVTALLTSSQNAGRDRLGTMNDRSGICSRHCKAANTDGRDQLYALSGIGGLFRSRLTWRFREVEDSTGVSPARGRSPTYPRQYVGKVPDGAPILALPQRRALWGRRIRIWRCSHPDTKVGFAGQFPSAGQAKWRCATAMSRPRNVYRT